MAVFADAGKVAARKADVDLRDLEASWGIGFRARIRDTVFMRTDFAVSREGFQVMWTFSDVFRIGF
jgi:hypothetical protein